MGWTPEEAGNGSQRAWRDGPPMEPLSPSHPVNHGLSLSAALATLAGGCLHRSGMGYGGFLYGSVAFPAQMSSAY